MDEGTHPYQVSEQTPATWPPDDPSGHTYVNTFGERVINRTPKNPSPPPGTIPFTRAADVPVEPLEWIWQPYLPKGKLVMLDGDPGTGKSSMCCWLAAQVSQGRPILDQPAADPRSVLMLSAEDGLSDTLRPRLEVNGANMQKVFVTDTALTLDDKGLEKLEKTIAFLKPLLVFIDPIVFYMGGSMDMNRANEVRRMTGRLSMMAGHYKCTIILVRHLRKQQAAQAIYRGQGTIDFVGAARSVLMLERKGTARTIMEHTKHNLGPKGTTMQYQIEDTGEFRWMGAVATKSGEISTKPKVRTTAEDLIKEALAGGPRAYTDIKVMAEAKGINVRALERAKAGLAMSRKEGAHWVWELLPQAPLTVHTVTDPGHSMSISEDPLPDPVAEALKRLGRGPVTS